MNRITHSLKRRLQRARRRRKVGRSYDMALEISRIIKPGSSVLDVGCGNGFIAHHLTGLLNAKVVGIDVGPTTDACLDYIPYDGRHFPLVDNSFDVIVLCYVLHHAQDARLVLNEVHRVLRNGGTAIIYEDNPASWWDRAVCWTHNFKWKGRTGPCTFQLRNEWSKVFGLAGFKTIRQRELSRWRNLAHPVARNFFVLTNESEKAGVIRPLRPEVISTAIQVEVTARS